MFIREELPQFMDYPVLLLVCDEHQAIAYRAFQHEINQIGSFQVPKPEYSDREDASHGGGNPMFESGAIFEKQKKLIRQEFKKSCEQLLRAIAITEPIHEAVVFCPPDHKRDVQEFITAHLKVPVRQVIAGIYCHETPFELVARLGHPAP